MLIMVAVLALASLIPSVEPEDADALAELVARKPVLTWLSSRIHPREVVASPFFFLLPAYLFAGIAWSIVDRTRQYRQARARGLEPAAARFLVRRELELALPADEAARRLVAEARRAGYEKLAVGEGTWRGGRGRIGFAGSIGFHVGLLVVLAGIVASALTRLAGEIILTEGFETPLTTESMLTLSGSGKFPELPGCTLVLRDLVATYSPQETPVDYAGVLAVRRGGETLAERLVRVNDAFEWGGFQLTLHRYGYAPELTAWDAAGHERVGGVAVLQVVPAGKEDSLPFEGGGELRLALYPDFVLVDGRPATRSPRPVNPVIEFSWREADGRQAARGRVGLGASTEVNGYHVAFQSLSNWGGFILARDRGLWLFVAGSLLGSLGLLLRIVFSDQSLKIEWQAAGGGTIVHLVAGTRFLPSLHEEKVDRLVTRIRSAEP